MNISEDPLTRWEGVWCLVKLDALSHLCHGYSVPLLPLPPPGWQWWAGLFRCVRAQCGHLWCFVATQNFLESLLFGEFPTIWIFPTQGGSGTLSCPDSLATGLSHMTGSANEMQKQVRFWVKWQEETGWAWTPFSGKLGGGDLWLWDSCMWGVLTFRA